MTARFAEQCGSFYWRWSGVYVRHFTPDPFS